MSHVSICAVFECTFTVGHKIALVLVVGIIGMDPI